MNIYYIILGIIILPFICNIIYYITRFAFDLMVTHFDGDIWFPKGYTIKDYVNTFVDDEFHKTYIIARWIPLYNILYTCGFSLFLWIGIIIAYILIIIKLIISYILKPIYNYLIKPIYIYLTHTKISQRLHNFNENIIINYNKLINYIMNIRLG